MKKARLIFVVPLFLYFVYGVFVSRYELNVLDSALEPPHPAGFYDYRGVINVHTQKSTGSGSLQDIVLAAQKSNLDFIFITDLNQFTPKSFTEKYFNDVLIFWGDEYSYVDSRILSLIPQDDLTFENMGQAQVEFSDLLSQQYSAKASYMFVLAHPLKPGFYWSGEFPQGFAGIELINLKTIWQKSWLSSRLDFIWTFFLYPFNPDIALIRLFSSPINEELRWWDDLNQKRSVIGFAGADAEARIKMFGRNFWDIPSYETLFSLVSNHVLLRSELTGQLNSDRRKILSALKRGQFYMSVDKLADPKGFLAILEEPGRDHLPGARVSWKAGMALRATMPEKPNVEFEIVLYRNGERIFNADSEEVKVQIHEPGVYRVEVRVIPTFPLPDGKKWITWIYTNPFYITQ